jgi:hypothetical protein
MTVSKASGMEAEKSPGSRVCLENSNFCFSCLKEEAKIKIIRIQTAAGIRCHFGKTYLFFFAIIMV